MNMHVENYSISQIDWSAEIEKNILIVDQVMKGDLPTSSLGKVAAFLDETLTFEKLCNEKPDEHQEILIFNQNQAE